MNESCVFCKIISGTIPATIVAETDAVLVIKDIAPKAPIHYLIIPKQHFDDIRSLNPADRNLAADLLLMAQELSTKIPAPGAFNLIANNGAAAGQVVHHLHIHFLAGKKLTPV